MFRCVPENSWHTSVPATFRRSSAQTDALLRDKTLQYVALLLCSAVIRLLADPTDDMLHPFFVPDVSDITVHREVADYASFLLVGFISGR